MLSNDPDQVVELTDVALKGLTFGMLLPPFSSPKEDVEAWISECVRKHRSEENS